ncbi:MAG TPA: N-acetylmuramoyl-L-alanine amidase [Nocardioides sp.]
MLPVSRVIGHKEWAPGRKSDPTYDMNWRRAGVAGIVPRGSVEPQTPAPKPVPRDLEDAMYLKCKPDPAKPDVLVGILSGSLLVGLGSQGEKDSAELAIQAGATVQWVEKFTWDAFDKASHRLHDNPRPVVNTNPVPAATAGS